VNGPRRDEIGKHGAEREVEDSGDEKSFASPIDTGATLLHTDNRRTIFGLPNFNTVARRHSAHLHKTEKLWQDLARADVRAGKQVPRRYCR